MTLGSTTSVNAALAIDERWLDYHGHRYSFRVFAAWLCWIHLWFDESESLVVHSAHAGRVYLLCHGVRHRLGDAAVHADDAAPPSKPLTCDCVDTVARYLFYTFIIDFSLEMLDLIHRIYEADDSFRSLDFMVHTKLYFSHIVVQIVLGTIAPITLLALTQVCEDLRCAPQTHLRHCRMPDPAWHFRHALECCDWRTAILEKFSGVHDIQDGLGHTGRLTDGNCADHSTVRDSVGAGEGPASLASERPGAKCRHHARDLDATISSRVSINAGDVMEVITDDLTRLSTRLEILERRVYALEHPSEEAALLPEQAERPSEAPMATREPQFCANRRDVLRSRQGHAWNCRRLCTSGPSGIGVVFRN